MINSNIIRLTSIAILFYVSLVKMKPLCTNKLFEFAVFIIFNAILNKIKKYFTSKNTKRKQKKCSVSVS